MSALLSTEHDYFQKLYETTTDPFRNWSNDYEINKRSIALGLLCEPHYTNVFEPGCGNGGLTLELSSRCKQLVSVDWSKDALIAANLHCAGVSNVDFQELNFPNQLPEERGFDLMVVSELLYYYSPAQLEAFFASLPLLLKPRAEIMLIHWRGLSKDYPSSGDVVHQAFLDRTEIEFIQSFEHPQFLISSGRLA